MWPEDSALHGFLFPWRDENPAFLSIRWENKMLSIEENQFNFFFSFPCEEKVLHQNDRAKWALRKKKIKTIVLSITEFCHCTNTPSRTGEFMGIPFSLGRNTGQEVYCLQSAPTPRWKSPHVSFSLRKLSWCILGPQ